VFLLVGLLLSGCTAQDKEKEPASNDAAEQNYEAEAEQDLNQEDSSQISVASILDRASSISSSTYDVVTKTADGKEQTVKVWWKGDKMRGETTIDMNGQSLSGVYILDREEEKSYAYMPQQNRAISMAYAKTKKELGDDPKSQSSEIKSKDFEVVAEEVWNDKDCVVVKYVSESGNETRTWIWKEYGLPVRFVSTSSQGETVTEIRNIEFTNISDTKFELPEGVQVIDIPTGVSL